MKPDVFLRPATRTLAVFVVIASYALATPMAVSSQEAAVVPPDAPALTWDPNDPRIGLAAGWLDAESAISGMEHLAELQRPAAAIS